MGADYNPNPIKPTFDNLDKLHAQNYFLFYSINSFIIVSKEFLSSINITSLVTFDREYIHWYKCYISLYFCVGYSIMAHYDDPVIPWWNEHFHEVYEDGTLERLCDEAKTKYGKKRLKINCIALNYEVRGVLN